MSEKKETPILKAEHLTKMFPVKKRKLIEKQKYVHAAEDVSFEVYPGEVLGIVGESGSGKSTLARTILALTPSTSGQVFYQGEDITDFKVSAGEKRRLRSEIQMIFQDPYASLNPKIKIGNAIAEPMLLHGQAYAAQGHRLVLLRRRCQASDPSRHRPVHHQPCQCGAVYPQQHDRCAA